MSTETTNPEALRKTLVGVVTNIIPSGSTFANTEGQESIFIPSQLSKENNLSIGDVVRMECVPQAVHRTPYRAYRLTVLDRA